MLRKCVFKPRYAGYFANRIRKIGNVPLAKQASSTKKCYRKAYLRPSNCNSCISPPNSLMDDQLSFFNASGNTAAILRVNFIQREFLPFDESIYFNTSSVELQVDVEIKSL